MQRWSLAMYDRFELDGPRTIAGGSFSVQIQVSFSTETMLLSFSLSAERHGKISLRNL